MRKVIVLMALSTLIFTGCVQTAEQTPAQNANTEIDYIMAGWCFREDPNLTEVCYETEVEKGTDAYTSLEQLDIQEEGLSVEAEDYGPELGYFVTRINNTAGNNENFWKLYVNGAEANVGISSIILNQDTALTFEYTAIE